MIRTSSTYIIMTVRVRSIGYELRAKEPKNLQPNQFAVKVSMSVDDKDWFNRMQSIDLGRVMPPEAPQMALGAMEVGPTIAETVLKRMIDTR